MREGTRVASIETGLAAAAAKLSQQVRKVSHLGLGSTPPVHGHPPAPRLGAVTGLWSFEYH